VTATPQRDLLERIEDYYDAVPRTAADVEDLGPFTLFVSRASWPYYARPARGYQGPPARAADVERVRSRMRELGIPEAFEWVDDLQPGLDEVVASTGLPVAHLPLQALTETVIVAAPPDFRLRLVDADDPDLPRINAAVHVGFGTQGTAVGLAGPPERDAQAAAADEAGIERLRDRLRRGLTVMAVAEDGSGPVAAGSHQPVAQVSEIVGVATLPSVRRRGLAAAVTALLVADARRRGVETVFLSAGSEDVARVYATVGFTRVATACIAEAEDV